jgi:anti-sigma-K factor RskA
VNAAEHPVDELPALLHGELRLDDLRTVSAHLRSCASCQRELVEIATGFGVLARAERQGLLDAEPPVLPALDELPADEPAQAPVEKPAELDAARSRRRTRSRWLVPVAAVVAVLLVASAAFLISRGGSTSSPSPTAQVALQPIDDRDASGKVDATGKVEMSGSGASRIMVVSTDLPPASRGHYYEVWLLDTRTNGMVAVGVLPTSGTAHFTLPDDLLSRYDAVDLSLQADNGNPLHSADSLLRAKYA